MPSTMAMAMAMTMRRAWMRRMRRMWRRGLTLAAVGGVLSLRLLSSAGSTAFADYSRGAV